MRYLLGRTGLAICALLVATVASAQNAGSLRGTVKDSTGAVVAGAHVVLTNEATKSTRTMNTDAKGGYHFAAVEPGVYTLRTDMTGFRAREIKDIRLSPSATLAVDVSLEMAERTEVVVVTGTREAIKTAQEIKLEAMQILDSIVATDIDKLPDRSVTEAMQRIPGVTITHFKTLGDPEHFSAEGSGVMVRGLTMVRSELNGRSSFTADGGRALSFQDVPPELLQRIDVYKNQSADLIEGGVGGTINLITKKPFDFDGRKVAAIVEGNYGDFVNKTHPSASLLFVDQWKVGGGQLGAAFDLAYSGAATRTDGVYSRAFFPRTDLLPGQTVYIPRGADWRTYTFDRKRQGGYGILQWKANDSLQMFFQAFGSKYKERWDESSIFVSNEAQYLVPAAGTTFEYDSAHRFVSGRLGSTQGSIPYGNATRFQDRDSRTTDLSYNLLWHPTKQWDVVLDLQRVDGSSKGLDSTVATGVDLPYIDVDLSGSRPQMTSDQTYLGNPSNYYMAFTMDNRTDNKASLNAGKLDVTYRSGTSLFRSIRLGARLTGTTSENHNTSYDWQPIYQPWMRWWAMDGTNPMPSVSPSDVSRIAYSDFYRGRGRNPGVFYSPSIALAEGFPQSFLKLHAAAAASGNYLCCYGQITPRDIDDDQWTTKVDETTQGFYLMNEFGWYQLKYPISGNVGLRVVRTDMSTHGSVIYPTTITDTNGNRGFDHAPESLEVTNTYTNVLPSANLRVNLRKDLLLRLAASRALSRPDFSQLQSYRALGAALPTGIGLENGPALKDFRLTADLYANPKLKPVNVDQFDLSLEWYFDKLGGMANANVFHKNVDGLISRAYTNEVYNGYTYLVTQPTNNGSGTITGLEVGLKKFFDKLPGPLKGLGVDLTYTYIDSDLTLTDVSSQPLDTDHSKYGALPFTGISKNAFNATLMYGLGPVSARLAYNWRSKFLMGVGQNGFNGGMVDGTSDQWRLPVYNDDYGQLDASLQYNLTRYLSLSLMAINLNNAETTLIAAQNAAGDHRSSYVNDRTYVARLSVNFPR
jgi:iron complex outermembrane recepter protein